MVLTRLNTLYQTHFLSKIAPLFHSPIKLTLAACISGVAIVPALLLNKYLALVLLILTGFLDTLDGAVARRCNKTSDLGAILDITSDRVVEFSIILGLYLLDSTRGLYCLLMLGSVLVCITTFLVVGLFSNNETEKGFHYSPGLIERAEAFFFFALMIVFPALFVPLASLFSLLVFLTAGIRLYQFAK